VILPAPSMGGGGKGGKGKREGGDFAINSGERKEKKEPTKKKKGEGKEKREESPVLFPKSTIPAPGPQKRKNPRGGGNTRTLGEKGNFGRGGQTIFTSSEEHALFSPKGTLTHVLKKGKKGETLGGGGKGRNPGLLNKRAKEEIL